MLVINKSLSCKSLKSFQRVYAKEVLQGCWCATPPLGFLISSFGILWSGDLRKKCLPYCREAVSKAYSHTQAPRLSRKQF